MARRRNQQNDSATAVLDTEDGTDSTETNETYQAEEPTVTTTEQMDETVAESTEDSDVTSTEDTATEAEAAPAEEPAPIDLTAFEAAVEAGLGERDETTGVVPVAQMEAINTEFRALDGVRGKNAGRNLLKERTKSAIQEDGDIHKARALMYITDNLSAGSSGGTTRQAAQREPVDPSEAVAAQRAILYLALENITVPEGVDEDELDTKVGSMIEEIRPEVASYLEWANAEVAEGEDRPAEPEVNVVAKKAALIALGRSTAARAPKTTSGGGTRTPFTGERKSIAKHIAEAFAGHPSGHFLSISEIASFESNEYRGDDGVFRKPSQGAISARLFPSSGQMSVEGVEAVEVDGRKGARKL